MNKSISIRVHGRVQGVWFRASTKQKADELEIFGTVRNEAQGTVFIEASGPEPQLETFIKWCRSGPKYAHVEKVDVQSLPDKTFTKFIILRT